MSTRGADGVNELRALLIATVRRLGLLERDQATCCGVTLAQCHALQEIHARRGLSVGELAGRLGVEPSTASRMVDGLVAQGWVAREPAPADRRAVTLTLTETGAPKAAELQAQAEAWAAQAWDAVPAAERPAVLRALATLVEALTHHPAPLSPIRPHRRIEEVAEHGG